MARAHSYTAWFLYALIGTVFLVLAMRYPAAYVRMTYEDLYGEWLQTWLFVAVVVLAVPLARRPGACRWFFVLLALAGFYTVMEEISWGQRIFGIESPPFFAENNVQGETNLHNFLTGPESTLLKDIVEYTLAGALVGYGLLYPLALRSGWRVARWLGRLGIASPPLYLWPFFVNAAVFEVGWFSFNEAEVAEIFVGTALVLMLLHYLVVRQAAPASNGPAQPGAAESARCGRLSLAIFAGLVALAFGTTALYASLPGRAETIDRRLANGYDKFARRLQNQGRRQDAAELYVRGYALGPENLPMLHKALDLYDATGDTANYRRYYRVMLDATAATLVTDPGTDPASVENLLMLADNYAGIDEQTVAEDYLDRALATAVAWVNEAPDDADGYYWLGRVHQQRKEYAPAMRAYQQARALAPGRSRYVLAVRSLQNDMAAAGESQPGAN